MRVQTLNDSIVLSGRFSNHPNRVAHLSVVNSPDLTFNGLEVEQEASVQVEAFLAQVVPAGVLIRAHDILHDKITRLTELGDLFDEIALEKIVAVVDPGLNAYIVQKKLLWSGGVESIDVCLEFITRAVNYVSNPHAELSV